MWRVRSLTSKDERMLIKIVASSPGLTILGPEAPRDSKLNRRSLGAGIRRSGPGTSPSRAEVSWGSQL